MRAKEWIEWYQKAARGDATYQELKRLDRGTVWGECYFDCYDILLIREGFARYERGEISLKYLKVWCSVYGHAIRIGHKIIVREEIAYSVIADILFDVANGEKTPQEGLQAIEYHNDILEGRREPLDSEYCVAEDEEGFYVENDEDGMKVDLLSIDHYRKTYTIYRKVSCLNTDGYDILGEPCDDISVSRMAFEALCKGVVTSGYQEKERAMWSEKSLSKPCVFLGKLL